MNKILTAIIPTGKIHDLLFGKVTMVLEPIIDIEPTYYKKTENMNTEIGMGTIIYQAYSGFVEEHEVTSISRGKCGIRIDCLCKKTIHYGQRTGTYEVFYTQEGMFIAYTTICGVDDKTEDLEFYLTKDRAQEAANGQNYIIIERYQEDIEKLQNQIEECKKNIK